jgi:hypothetical protein
MIEHIIELIDTVTCYNASNNATMIERCRGAKPDLANLCKALVEELDRLDPRDFEPSSRHQFIVSRAEVRSHAKNVGDGSFVLAAARRLKPVLSQYAGEGTGAKTRDFEFVSNSDVRAIVERDYRELMLRTFPDGSWKSTVILAGSILEAVLYDLLTKDQAAISNAMNSPKAPKKSKNGPVKDITKHSHEEQWTLSYLIEVACDLKILPPEDKDAIHQVLREYRNFVHPRLEVKRGIRISEGHATAAKGALDIILDRLMP